MKIRQPGILALLICCVAGLACVTVPAVRPVYTQPPPVAVAVPAGAEGEPFYGDLAPYGQWIFVSGPGWVWAPYDVAPDWAPYELGHWVFTDYGWTWASDEDFGWAVYHYGRWHHDRSYGWVWVPGTDWAPAWVAWHEGGGWVGWAPLPYQARWSAEVGLDWGGLSVNVAIGPSAWHFVPSRHLVDAGLRSRIAPPSRNVALIRITRNVTHYSFVNHRIEDRSVRVENIGRAVGHPIRQYRVRQGDSPESARRGREHGQDFVVFRGDPSRGARGQDREVSPGHDRGRSPESRRDDGRNERGNDGRAQPPRREMGQRPASETGPRPGTPPEQANPRRGFPFRDRGAAAGEEREQNGEPHPAPRATPPAQESPARPGAEAAAPADGGPGPRAERDRSGKAAPSASAEPKGAAQGHPQGLKTGGAGSAAGEASKVRPSNSKGKKRGDAGTRQGKRRDARDSGKKKDSKKDSKKTDSEKPGREDSDSGS